MINKAIGLIEVIGFTNAVVAADESLKAASVKLIGVEKVDGGIVTVKLMGDVSAVMAAVEAGKAKVINTGNFRAAHVIPRLDPEVFCILQDVQSKKEESKEVIEEVQTVVAEDLNNEVNIVKEVQAVTTETLNNKVEITEEVQVVMTEALNNETNIKEETIPAEVLEIVEIQEENKEVLTKDKYSKLNVKELRKLAVTMRVVKTLKEAKQLKKDELVIKLLGISK